MMRPVTREEIKMAVLDIEEDKAPGPDGFSSSFYKAAWTAIGDEVTLAVQDFFASGKLLRQINSTLITLIPKVAAPTVVGEFRPFHATMSSTRRISSNILLAQELFSGYNRRDLPPRCAIKVDLRKAYDMLEWDFIIAALHLFGFPDRIVSWIEECITSTLFLLSFNGGSFGFSFRALEGLDKGTQCPLTCLSLLWKYFKLLLAQRVDQSEEFRYHWHCEEIGLINLCFDDDLLLFCRAEVHPVQLFRDGLRALLDVLGFQEGTLPVRSVISSLNIYWAMAFVLPKGVIKAIEARMRKFLWYGNTGSGLAKVAWTDVCKPVEEGGQGIRAREPLNKALMSQHFWFMELEEDSMAKEPATWSCSLYGWVG
ncbi:UNVERIFIED_CONTAM: hypothetical protein Slati_2467200 [Sesamum latifolium]|uniref:Reverse transcriptase domain-containing protein n=1 Tax=Sesamum latifolium TaxID=2727402 RepID=A0AAW2WDC0_9LAMI